MRFLIDMPLSPAVALWLAGQGHDAVHAATLNLATAPDTAIMAHAKGDNPAAEDKNPPPPVGPAIIEAPRLVVLCVVIAPTLLFVTVRIHPHAKSIHRITLGTE